MCQHVLHSHLSLTMAHGMTCFALSLTDATYCFQYHSQYFTHLPSTHASHLSDFQSSEQPTCAYINTYWTCPAAQSADCNLSLWNSILSALIVAAQQQGEHHWATFTSNYFFFFFHFRPIFMVALHDSQQDPLASAAKV